MSVGQILGVAAMSWLGFVAGGLFGCVAFAVLDRVLDLYPSEPPFQWAEPMLWTAFVGAAVGAWICGMSTLLFCRQRSAASLDR